MLVGRIELQPAEAESGNEVFQLFRRGEVRSGIDAGKGNQLRSSLAELRDVFIGADSRGDGTQLRHDHGIVDPALPDQTDKGFGVAVFRGEFFKITSLTDNVLNPAQGRRLKSFIGNGMHVEIDYDRFF